MPTATERDPFPYEGEAIDRRVDELKAYERRHQIASWICWTLSGFVRLVLFLVLFVVLIATLMVTVAHAKPVCGRYVGGAHQHAIIIDISQTSDETTDILLNNLDAFIVTPKIGSCVCAYGTLRGETFIRLRRMQLTGEGFCKAKGI